MTQRTLILSTICCLMAAVSFAQDAKTTLNTFVQKMYAYPAVEIAFTAQYENLQDATSEEHKGTTLCSGDKFRLVMGDTEVYCDGKSKWLYNASVDEVTIFPVGEANDITDNPLRFITAYRDGFKYNRKPSRIENGKQLDEIELYPNDRKSNYTAIILTMEAKTLTPYAVKYNTKDGRRYTIHITRFSTEVKADENSFIFPSGKYPSAEIVDLR